jgi:hypothetical protein
MANGWTPERRARQRELIQRWKPWQRSTGSRTAEGKKRVSRNGYKGGSRLLLRELARLLRQMPTRGPVIASTDVGTPSPAIGHPWSPRRRTLSDDRWSFHE